MMDDSIRNGLANFAGVGQLVSWLAAAGGSFRRRGEGGRGRQVPDVATNEIKLPKYLNPG
jgi:hypothetical protein